MADYKSTITWSKSGSAFTSFKQAIEQHIADAPTPFSNHTPAISDEASHISFVNGQTNFTETRSLASGGTAVSDGTAGNGYQLVRTWNEAKLITYIEDTGWPNTTNLETGGWTIECINANADTGAIYGDEHELTANEKWQSAS